MHVRHSKIMRSIHHESDEKEHIRLERAEAREEGREAGILIGKREMIRFTQLIGVLLQEGKIDDVVRVTKDEAIRERYYTEYHIQ